MTIFVTIFVLMKLSQGTRNAYTLTLSWRKSLSYRNWFLYNRDLRHERGKDDYDLLSDNYNHCKTWLKNLAKQLSSNTDLLDAFKRIIKSQLDSGIIESVLETASAAVQVYYLPHHPVPIKQQKFVWLLTQVKTLLNPLWITVYTPAYPYLKVWLACYSVFTMIKILFDFFGLKMHNI